jgi:DDE family transposase
MSYVAVSDADEAVLAGKFAVMRRVLNEAQWRVYLGAEADALDYGGVAAVARASGASQATVKKGLEESRDPAALAALGPGRSRRPGAGRPEAGNAQPGLGEALDELLEEGRRGDPVREIAWSTLSLRQIADRLAARGFTIGKDALARLMHAKGYSLRGMSRVLEGRQHPDRDAQFRHVNAMIAWFARRGEPVISVDAKKKEQLGPFRRDGRSWRPAGDPVRVRDHDFPDEELGKITPYGVYDVTANRGFVSVGASHDTGAFAVNAIRLWWQEEGQFRYEGAARLLVTCDCGGSNGYRCRQWKRELACLARETGLKISVCHFPPGTSKWNKIEHRLFCHITRTWSARPLMSAGEAVAGIAATVTSTGLKCTAVRDDGDYPEGIKVPGTDMRHLEQHAIIRHGPHPEWNYTIIPAPAPARGNPGPDGPGPAGPCPDLTAALAALAGLPAPDTSRLMLEWTAARTRQLTLARGRESLRPRGNGGYTRLSPDAILAAAACHLALGMPWALLARLHAVHPSSISVPAATAIPVLRQHGITRQPGTPRITTTARLHAAAAAAGITLTTPGETPQHHQNRHIPETSDTPETTS